MGDWNVKKRTVGAENEITFALFSTNLFLLPAQSASKHKGRALRIFLLLLTKHKYPIYLAVACDCTWAQLCYPLGDYSHFSQRQLSPVLQLERVFFQFCPSVATATQRCMPNSLQASVMPWTLWLLGEFLFLDPSYLWSIWGKKTHLDEKVLIFPEESDSVLQTAGHIQLLTSIKREIRGAPWRGAARDKASLDPQMSVLGGTYTHIHCKKKKQRGLFSKTQDPKLPSLSECKRLKTPPVKLLSLATRRLWVDWSADSTLSWTFCSYQRKPWCRAWVYTTEDRNRNFSLIYWELSFLRGLPIWKQEAKWMNKGWEERGNLLDSLCPAGIWGVCVCLSQHCRRTTYKAESRPLQLCSHITQQSTRQHHLEKPVQRKQFGTDFKPEKNQLISANNKFAPLGEKKAVQAHSLLLVCRSFFEQWHVRQDFLPTIWSEIFLGCYPRLGKYRNRKHWNAVDIRNQVHSTNSISFTRSV